MFSPFLQIAREKDLGESPFADTKRDRPRNGLTSRQTETKRDRPRKQTEADRQTDNQRQR